MEETEKLLRYRAVISSSQRKDPFRFSKEFLTRDA